MQITKSVVCGASNGCIYKQIKPPLVGEHAFPLTGFVYWSAHVTNVLKVKKKKISNDQELKQSEPTSRPRNQSEK